MDEKQKADEQKAEGGKHSQRLTVALGRLEDVFTSDQVEQMIDVLVMTFDNAVTRKCDQTFTILFNDKGYPIGFNGSNNVKPVRPASTYKAE